MRIDIHVHTDYSRCSRFEYNSFAGLVKSMGLGVVTVTDHGLTQAWERLLVEIPELLVIPGVEVRAREGDFLVYSTDAEYIRNIGPYVPQAKDIRRDDNTVVVWAHPRVASETGWQAPHKDHQLVHSLVEHIDAIEVINNNMFRDKSLTQSPDKYVETLVSVAERHCLPMTGGSDAHSASQYMSSWTEFPNDIDSVESFINGIRSGVAKPGCEDGILNSCSEFESGLKEMKSRFC